MKRILSMSLLIACLLLIAADCNQSFVNSSKKTLYTVKATWYTVQDSVKTFAESGKLPPLAVEKFRTLDNRVRICHRGATDALQAYEIVANSQGQARVSALIGQLFSLMVEAVELYRQWNLPAPADLVAIAKGGSL